MTQKRGFEGCNEPISSFLPRDAGCVRDAWGKGAEVQRATAHLERLAVPAVNLAAAGAVAVTVVNPSLEAAPSNGKRFDVTNPTPMIAQLRLEGATLTGIGSNFVAGATLSFNGTTYLASGNASQLQVTLSADDAKAADGAEVTVDNLAPGGGSSNVATSDRDATTVDTRRVYLPIMRR